MSENPKMKVAIVGASGYSGVCLLGLLLAHPEVEILALCGSSQVGESIESIYPRLRGLGLPQITAFSELDLTKIDILFTATPNGFVREHFSSILTSGVRLIDLSADLRFDSGSEVAYGLSEWNRVGIESAPAIANPGCYPTASLLALLPLLEAGLVDLSRTIIIDAKSGVTGAGRQAEKSLLFGDLAEDFYAYKPLSHRHTPEIELYLSRFGGAPEDFALRFTPHLLPVKRGILASIHFRPSTSDLGVLQGCLLAKYSAEQFVDVLVGEALPRLSNVRHTNFAQIWVGYDPRTGEALLLSAIDNLMKGAAGQAVQNFNIMFGFPEALGLAGHSVLALG